MIAAMLILVFTNIRTGLIGMIPNITPVIILADIMGYFRFQLDMMTMTIMPMILGIIPASLSESYEFDCAACF